MTKELFKDWLTNIFLKQCCTARPVLLILDNHSTHTDVDTVTLAKEAGIIMLALPPHTSHLYQPLDVGVFGPLKRAYKSSMKELQLKVNKKDLKEKDYTNLLYQACLSSVTKDNILGGFHGSCIYPVDKECALAKLKPEEKKNSNNAKSSSIFSEILSIPESPLPAIKEKDLQQDRTLILTCDIYIEKAKKVKADKEKKEAELTAKRKTLQVKKKVLLEKKAQRALIKEQKKKKAICNCRSACGKNNKCPCFKAKRSCTEYCGCHQHCNNSYNTKSTTLNASSSDDVICCVHGCGKSMKGQSIVECTDCHKRCHKETCAMPFQRTIDGKEVHGYVCNDCGEKE